MADHNSTPADPKLELEKYTPAAQRIFARKFAGVTLTSFRRFGLPTGDLHLLAYRGTENDLLRYGLVDAEEVPKKPERIKYNGASDRHAPWICVKRAKGGDLDVLRHLKGEPLPEEHPLSEFDPRNWPFVGAEAVEPLASETYLQAAAVPLATLSEFAGHFSEQLGMEVRQRLGQIDAMLKKERERLAELRRPSHLRLVIDNTLGGRGP